jgi:hypothetical protein
MLLNFIPAETAKISLWTTSKVCASAHIVYARWCIGAQISTVRQMYS